jgi:hypothetical protein
MNPTIAGIKHAVWEPTVRWPAEAGVESAAAAVGDTPHFHGPFASYANSPLPSVRGGVAHVGNSLTARQFANDYATAPCDFGRLFVTVPAQLPHDPLKSFRRSTRPTRAAARPPPRGHLPRMCAGLRSIWG